MSKAINLDDLLEGVTPYEPALLRLPNSPAVSLSDSELLDAAAKTAKDILVRNGATKIEVTAEDALIAQEAFQQRIANQRMTLPDKPETVLKLEALVSQYDWKVIEHANQIRLLVTNKLLELSDNRDPRVQLKAVELLGKIADVGMFVEKQEVTYKQQPTEALEQKLKEKLGMLIEGEIIGDKVVTREEIKATAQDPNAIPLPDTPRITKDTVNFLLDEE